MAEPYSHSPASGKKLLLAIVFNIGITMAEFAGGFISGYLALIADAVHNLSDVAALGLAWLGIKGSRLPATKKSTYGFKRIEVMTALISAVSLVVIAVFILREAYNRFIDPHVISEPGVFLTVACIGLIGNILSIWILHSEKGKSLNLRTAFLHMAYDTASSVAVIAGGVAILITGWVAIDVFLSAIIAVMILWSSYLVIKEAVLIFLEAVPKGIDFDAVLEAVEDVPRVRQVHDLHIWSLSSHEAALSCHIAVAEKDFPAGPDIIARVNTVLKERFHIGHCTIQVGLDDCNRPEVLCRFGARPGQDS